MVQSQWCNYRVISHPVNHVIDAYPEIGYDHGREAAGIAAAWFLHEPGPAAGLLLLGCDIAADPDDYEAMAQAVKDQPGDLHTGMVKLWPYSTSRSDWMWSHRGGTLGQPAATQDEDQPVAYVSLGYLWVPRRLLDLAYPVMATWRWGEADVKLSELALTHGIPAHAVKACRPKHLHYQEEHDGAAIAERASRVRDIPRPGV